MSLAVGLVSGGLGEGLHTPGGIIQREGGMGRGGLIHGVSVTSTGL